MESMDLFNLAFDMCLDFSDAKLGKIAREIEKGPFESSTWEINYKIWGYREKLRKKKYF